MEFRSYKIKIARISRNTKGGKRQTGEAELSLKKLSELSGFPVATLWTWESGVSTPSASKIGKLAAMLGVSVDFFYTPQERTSETG